MSEQLNRIEEMMGTLIKMVGDNNARLKSVEEKLDRNVKKVESDLNTHEHHFNVIEKRITNLEIGMDKLTNK